MKTRRYCPKCGRPVIKSELSKFINKYSFQCYGCGEDFYKFEVLRKQDKERILQLRRLCIDSESAENRHIHSVYKPYPRTANR